MRYFSYDLIRTYAAISAIIIHFRNRSCIPPTDIFWFIQKNIITVGGVFFFVSGIMLYKIYFPKFQKDKMKVVKRVIYKSIVLFLIYLGYLIFMYIVSGLSFPDSVSTFLFKRAFFNKILLKFSLIFAFSPLFLFLIEKIKKVFFFVILAFFFISLSYVGFRLYGSGLLQSFLFDVNKQTYPLIAYFCVYSLGIFYGMTHVRVGKHSILILISTAVPLYLFFYENQFLKPVRESITLFMLFLLLDHIFSARQTEGKLRYIGVAGVESLTFYVFGNLLVSLLPNICGSPTYSQIFILLSILVLCYLMSLWHHKSKNTKSLKGKLPINKKLEI